MFGGKFVDDIFPMERAALVPLFTAANLLSMYRPVEKHWWEYLDQIWDAYEAAGKLSAVVLPALTYLVHLTAAPARSRPASRPRPSNTSPLRRLGIRSAPRYGTPRQQERLV